MVILPQLRNALTCRVCRGLIVDPVSSKYCQHYVCRACLKRKRALNPGCKWCLDWSKLQQSDGQIQVLLVCYKLLCEAIKSSSYYVNGAKNATIDKLLKEAKLNTDMLPNSSFILSKNSNLESQFKMANIAVEVASRDELETCARENVTNNENTNDGGKPNVKEMQETITNGILESCDEELAQCPIPTKAIVEENKDQEQLEVNTMETDDTTVDGQDGIVTNMSCNVTHSNCDSVIQMESDTKEDPNLSQMNLNGGINNDVKAHIVRKVKSKNMRACLRPRNGQLVQKFEPGRYMRKREFGIKCQEEQ